MTTYNMILVGRGRGKSGTFVDIYGVDWLKKELVK